MITVLSGFPETVLAFEASGHVTAVDYERVMIPAIAAAHDRHEPLRLLYRFSAEFEGFGVGAMWDDARVGVKYFSDWKRIAVVCDQNWLQLSVRAFAFMVPGEIKVFALDEMDAATRWVSQ